MVGEVKRKVGLRIKIKALIQFRHRTRSGWRVKNGGMKDWKRLIAGKY
jgi:hypothetical protein